MKPARLVILGVALAAGATAAWLASGRPEAPKAEPPPPPLATTDVLVAKSDLDTGQVIGDGDVVSIVRTPVSAGEPIRDSKVVAAKGGGFMAAVLPKGMRAVSLDIAPDTDAGGFILPNDHVDVVLTQRNPTNQKTQSETILTNVRVLAVDQTIGEKDGTKVIIGKTATIEVNPPQIRTLATARQLGTISLALRSLLDAQSPIPIGEEDSGGIKVVRFGVK
jgi:pilus assembly protein CpaB